MSWSLGEVGALAVKAARGAGMPWGLADETGFAVKWLQARSLPGVTALCRYLSRYDGASHHINPQSGLANRPMSGPYSRNRCRYMTPGGVAFRSDHKNEQANRHSAIGPREGRSTMEYGIK